MANGSDGNQLVPGGYQPDFGSVELGIDPALARIGRYRGPYNALNPMGLPIVPIDSEMQPVVTSRMPDPRTLTGLAKQPPPGPGAGTVGPGAYDPYPSGTAEAQAIASQIKRLRAAGDNASADNLQRALEGIRAGGWKPPSRPGDPTNITVPPPESNSLAPGGAVSTGRPQVQVQPPNALAPTGATPAAPVVDPDAGKFLPDGTPVSVAKRFLRQHESGPHGYNAAFGYSDGLPAGFSVSSTGYPLLEGKPIPPSMYGGRYVDPKTGKPMISHAKGMYQNQPGSWDEGVAGLAKEGVVINDFSPESQERVNTWLLQKHGMSPWAPFNDSLNAAYNAYKSSGKEPQFSGPLAYWEPGYTPGAMASERRPGGQGLGGRASGGTQIDLPVTAPAPPTQRQYEPPPDLSSEGGMGGALKGMYLMQLFNQMAQGRKLTPVHVDYDPFKVREVTRQQSPNYSLSVGVQGIGAGLGPGTRLGYYGT